MGHAHGIPIGAGYARDGTSALRLDRGRGAVYNWVGLVTEKGGKRAIIIRTDDDISD